MGWDGMGQAEREYGMVENKRGRDMIEWEGDGKGRQGMDGKTKGEMGKKKMMKSLITEKGIEKKIKKLTIGKMEGRVKKRKKEK